MRESIRSIAAALLFVVAIAFAFVGAGFAQWPPPGSSDRARYEDAFFGTDHFVHVTMRFEHRGVEESLDSVFQCAAAKHFPAPILTRKSYRLKLPSRSYLSMGLKDGSIVFVHLPPDICGFWQSLWMPPELAKTMQPDNRFPANFHPLIDWSDRKNDPDRFERYPSRYALAVATSEIVFKGMWFDIVERAEWPQARVRSERENSQNLRHPIREYNKTPDNSSWDRFGFYLTAAPEAAWRKFPRLVAMIERSDGRTPIVFQPDDIEAAKPEMKELARLMSPHGGQVFEAGLPGPDGRAGVTSCVGHDQTARYLPNRCTVPRDWDIPVECDHEECRALLGRRGTHIYFRSDGRRKEHWTIKFDGLSVRRSQSGKDALIYIPSLKALVFL